MLQSYAEIPPEMPEWLWEGRIPRAFACLAAGPGGLGKGNVMTDIAARVTRGDMMPDGTPGPEAGSVITITPEDHQRKVMAWRLRAAKADLARVFDMTGKVGNRFKLPRDLGRLSAAVREVPDCRMVLLDPLAAISSISLTSSNNRLREQLMEPLEALAADTGIALVINGHTVASGKIAGSVALVQAARMVLKFAGDQQDPRIRRISVDKSNISRDDIPDIAYSLLEGHPAPSVEWVEEGEGVAKIHELGASQERILDLLKIRGPMGARDIADATGINYAVVRVLLNKLARKNLAENPERGQWKAA